MLASCILKVGFFGFFKYCFLFLFFLSFLNIVWCDCFLYCGLFMLVFCSLLVVDYKKLLALWSLYHTGVGLLVIWHIDIVFFGLVFFVEYVSYCEFCIFVFFNWVFV